MIPGLRDISREKIPHTLRKIGWGGILLGFIVSVVASPWVNVAIAEVAHKTDAPGYGKADLDFAMQRTNVLAYHQGQKVEYYNGLTWDDEYRIYELSIEHNGERTLKNVKIDVPLPGCVVYTKDSGEGVRGIYEVRNPIGVSIRASNESVIQKYPCTKRIVTEQLSPSQEIRVEFVVTRKFDDCDLLVGYRNNPETSNIRVQYYFEKRGHVMKEQLTAGTPADDYRFKQPLDRPSTGMYQIVRGDLGEYPVLILGKQANSFKDAVAKCG